MRKIRCYDCGRVYDYDVDDFCPRCGAYTQPARKSCIDAQGVVVRVDGINEAYHKESFVHKELHHENRKRKGTLLEQGDFVRKQYVPRKKKSSRPVQIAAPLQNRGETKKEENASGSFIVAIIAAIVIAILQNIF